MRQSFITHVDNLARIAADGELLSDAAIIRRGGPATGIGMATIKGRRLRLPVGCHPGDTVGDCVPFNFCPRSVMLYVIHKANHPELAYRGGQDPIVHLEADLHEVVGWAAAERRRWAITPANAGAVYTDFYCTLDDLDRIDWACVVSNDFRAAEAKEAKQAEFLVQGAFPWTLVRRIGVKSQGIRARVAEVLAGVPHQPGIEIRSEWYF